MVWGKELCIMNKLIDDGLKEILLPNLIDIHEVTDNRIVTRIDDLSDIGRKTVVIRTGDILVTKLYGVSSIKRHII